MSDSFDDPYCYHGSHVLINKFGFVTLHELRRAEHIFVSRRAADFDKNPIKGNYDMVHLRAIHGYLFQDVYDWAGELRTVDMAKDGSPFCLCDDLERAMKGIHEELRDHQFLGGLNKKQFVDQLASYFSEVNFLHPFREGNGRATRLFIGQLAKDAGYTFYRKPIERDKKSWNQASALSIGGELGELKRLFNKTVRPTRSVAFELYTHNNVTKPALLRKHPDLKTPLMILEETSRYLTEHGFDKKDQRASILNLQQHLIKKLDLGITQHFDSGVMYMPQQGKKRVISND
ncbi:MAG: Fic family protein [Burkholderiales bacterium]|jgi:cell filamentation protein|nr:Fic family protein [Burkholderiales bacterium]